LSCLVSFHKWVTNLLYNRMFGAKELKVFCHWFIADLWATHCRSHSGLGLSLVITVTNRIVTNPLPMTPKSLAKPPMTLSFPSLPSHQSIDYFGFKTNFYQHFYNTYNEMIVEIQLNFKQSFKTRLSLYWITRNIY